MVKLRLAGKSRRKLKYLVQRHLERHVTRYLEAGSQLVIAWDTKWFVLKSQSKIPLKIWSHNNTMLYSFIARRADNLAAICEPIV
jgi:hypothetical protein